MPDVKQRTRQASPGDSPQELGVLAAPAFESRIHPVAIEQVRMHGLEAIDRPWHPGLPSLPPPRRVDRVPSIAKQSTGRQSVVPVLKADHRPPDTLAGSFSLLKPQDYQLAIQVLGTPARDVGQVDFDCRNRITHTIT